MLPPASPQGSAPQNCAQPFPTRTSRPDARSVRIGVKGQWDFSVDNQAGLPSGDPPSDLVHGHPGKMLARERERVTRAGLARQQADSVRIWIGGTTLPSHPGYFSPHSRSAPSSSTLTQAQVTGDRGESRQTPSRRHDRPVGTGERLRIESYESLSKGVAMAHRLSLGMIVSFKNAPGLGRVGDLDATRVRVDFFESAAEPVVGSQWLPVSDVRRAALSGQTRVFFRDGRGRWRAGRVVGGQPDGYFVRIPNVQLDVDIPETQLFVRWERAPKDPLQVLLSGANETPRYRDVREPVRRLLVAERAASGSATGIVSSGVQLHAHQINAALRIIRDPIQRYLLADEVGMGKTVQAGLVMRQILHDAPGRRIGVLVPDALMGQWRAELRDKFHLSDFPTRDGEDPVRILGHGQVDEWRRFGDLALLVVDEAHLLTRASGPCDVPYKQLAEIAHASPRLLMLSATPFSRGAATHLALLHLLDPALFRWDEFAAFESLLESRHSLALAVFGLDEEPDVDNPELLQLQFDQVRENLPEDDVLRAAIDRAMTVYGPEGTPPEDVDLRELRLAVAAVRAHVSETYRLHQRVIRNRRHVVEKQRLDDEGLLAPFEFTGRSRPKVARSDDDEIQAGVAVVAAWASRCADAVLDDGIDPVTYGPALGVLFSRLGGSIDDVCAVLAHRLGGDATSASLLPAERAALDAAPVLPFEADVLARACEAVGGGGVAATARQIAKRTPRRAKAVVFCGRGSLAPALAAAFTDQHVSGAYRHVTTQSDEEREQAVSTWLDKGGVLVVDDTGDVGRNFQWADIAFHVRLPANPNSLEQRIGRIDRYGREGTAQQYVLTDDDRQSITSAWLGALVRSFGIFDTSIAALQEVVEDLTDEVWTALLRDGVEAVDALAGTITDGLAKEKRRINELDALEASYAGNEGGQALATAIAAYENDVVGIERAYRALIEGEEGFRFVSKSNKDGSIAFDRDPDNKPLLSERLLGRVMNVQVARTGHFDRWRLTPGRALFRRGNPFIDGIEDLLNLDDRGQAVAMWRLNPAWRQDPLAFFGFDFLVEADVRPTMALLGENADAAPVARRRADAAFPPQHQRIWLPITSTEPVSDPCFVKYLSKPFAKAQGDVNLNAAKIPALHALVGGEQHLASVANACFDAASARIEAVADIVEASKRAVERVTLETEVLLARGAARAKAAGLVVDPDAMEGEIELSRAIESGVSSPVIRVTGVSVVVVSAQSHADYV